MSESQTPQKSSQLRNWLAYALAWIPAAALYAIAAASQRDVTWWHGVITGIVVMGVAALEGVAVWHITGRSHFPPRSRVRFAFTHLVAAFAYSTLWLIAVGAWLWLVAGRNTASFVMGQAGVWQFSSGIYLYSLIAGFSYLLRAQRELRERATAAARAEAAAARAQLQSVRAHLNPHFLFNALHAVSSLVRVDARAADRAIEQLGELLRRSLDHGNRELVPLGDEWAFVRAYLELEQLRLGDRLRLDCKLEPDALAVLVPPFLIQPLVENAVRHGVAKSAAGGTVEVSAARRNGTLYLRIADDGPGAAPDRLEQRMGFGIDGVRQQLEARFGKRAKLEIESRAGPGFAVSLSLPIEGDV
jgi:sensor histidine kinase YesM